jgi:four helix bundle protein
MPIDRFQKLKIWQLGMDLMVETYRLTKSFPRNEQYGLSSQAREAAVSIPANIAEGHGRFYRGDFHKHLTVARGSLMELDTHLEIARRLGYISQEELAEAAEMIDHLARMLTSMASKMKPSPPLAAPGTRHAERS